MRTVMLGSLVVAGLVLAAMGMEPNRNVVFAQRSTSVQPALPEGQLIALSTTVGEQYQQLSVIDPKSRVLAIYHVDLKSGEVALCSVRNIHWDLQMDSFNTKTPLPQEVQSLLEAGRLQR
jgi:hypothetical protein